MKPPAHCCHDSQQVDKARKVGARACVLRHTGCFRLAPLSAAVAPSTPVALLPGLRSLDTPQCVDSAGRLVNHPDHAPDVGAGEPELAAPGHR
jgi:hypothetical protein